MSFKIFYRAAGVFLLFGIALQAQGQVEYGATNSGGRYGYGTIFKYYPVNDSFVKVHDFDSIDGAHPYGNLIQCKDGNLYGTTLLGGINDLGVLFKYDVVSNSYEKLYDVGSQGNLIQFTNGQLYGLNGHSLFEYNLNDSTYTDEHDFGSGTDGYNLRGSLTILNGKLYGMSLGGGVYTNGTIFQYDPDNDIYIKDFDFNENSNGALPSGNLTVANGELYGMTPLGGTTGGGILFEFQPVDSNLIIKFNFDTFASPLGSILLANDGKMYGMSNGHPGIEYPVLFQFDTSTNKIITEHVFDSIPGDGAGPQGSLIQSSNGFLYGMTTYGGINAQGTIFSYNYNTNTYTKLVDLDSTTGINPFGDLLEVNENLGINKVAIVNSLSLFPNPATTEVTLQNVSLKQDGEIRITDVTGRTLITNYTSLNSKIVFDIHTLTSGIYLVELKQDNLNYTGRFVKMD